MQSRRLILVLDGQGGGMGTQLIKMLAPALPADCDLLGGDLVVTSGLGGFFPAGLVIGSVEELQMDDSGASSYAILAPAVDFSSLQQVVVIRSFDASN